jgi:hypothetical protein
MLRVKPLQPSRQEAASCFHQRRLVGVSAPAVPPTTAPAAAPRPRPRMAPAAAPPPAPMPTFLARLRLPLLRLLLLEVAAITGKAVSASSPKHRATAHSDFFTDRPSPNKICNQSAKLGGSLQSPWLHQFRHPARNQTGCQRTVLRSVCTVLFHVDHPKLNAPRARLVASLVSGFALDVGSA